MNDRMAAPRCLAKPGREPRGALRRAAAMRGVVIVIVIMAVGIGMILMIPRKSAFREGVPPANVQGTPFRTEVTTTATAPVAQPTTSASQPRPIISSNIPGMMPILLDSAKLATIGEDVDDDGTIHLSIDQLACYPYDLLAMNEWLHDPEAGPRPDQIPVQVRRLNGKRVELRGYMMPVTMYEDGTPMFLLLRDALACCFGMAHGMNAWVRVEMKNDERVGYVSGTPIVVRGTLEVGEQIEDDLVMSIYRLRGERVRRMDGY